MENIGAEVKLENNKKIFDRKKYRYIGNEVVAQVLVEDYGFEEISNFQYKYFRCRLHTFEKSPELDDAVKSIKSWLYAPKWVDDLHEKGFDYVGFIPNEKTEKADFYIYENSNELLDIVKLLKLPISTTYFSKDLNKEVLIVSVKKRLKKTNKEGVNNE